MDKKKLLENVTIGGIAFSVALAALAVGMLLRSLALYMLVRFMHDWYGTPSSSYVGCLIFMLLFSAAFDRNAPSAYRREKTNKEA